jgi:ribosomal protein S18 acetylase RimI-like enzyme
VNSSNLDKEHICCSLSDKKGENGVASKKTWLKERFEEGLVFKKADVRGKVFIEYIPAEKAWCPIDAEGYLFINCFWVSGQYKGQGIGGQLLEECIKDGREQNKKGIAVLSSKKKMPFLSDPKFLKYKGFEVCDTAKPYYELLCLRFDETAPLPKFKDCAKEAKTGDNEGVALYYSHQCPFTEKYTHLLEQIAKDRAVPFILKRYTTAEEAQKAPVASTTYSLFVNGEFMTNEILTEDKFIKLLDEKCLIRKY